MLLLQQADTGGDSGDSAILDLRIRVGGLGFTWETKYLLLFLSSLLFNTTNRFAAAAAAAAVAAAAASAAAGALRRGFLAPAPTQVPHPGRNEAEDTPQMHAALYSCMQLSLLADICPPRLLDACGSSASMRGAIACMQPYIHACMHAVISSRVALVFVSLTIFLFFPFFGFLCSLRLEKCLLVSSNKGLLH